jgi:exodeoxyribonuclease VII small subunit
MAEKKENNDISKLSFEQAIEKLTDIASKIEEGQISLEQSLTQYEQGTELIKHCRAILQKAEKKIEQITEQEKEKEK